MADFVQVMKDWRRLCRTMEAEHPDDGCNHCPLLDLSQDKRGCDAIYADEFADNVDWRELEKRVTKWAAEHPVVYPTWGEWFVSKGMLPEKWDNLTSAYMNVGCVPNLIYSPIPADIAEKLGIEPKEDT